MVKVSEDARFSCAVIATMYLLGDRGDGLSACALGPSSLALSRALASADRETRVTALAREVAHIAVALDQGGLG